MTEWLTDLRAQLRDHKESGDPFLDSEMWAILGEHHDDCDQCATGQMCAPLSLLGRLLRVDRLRDARTAVEALANEARQFGAPVLTMLRRPELDDVDRSNTSPPGYADVELFGFEIVLPGSAVPVAAPGLSLSEFRVVDFTGSGGARPLVRLHNGTFTFSDAIRRIVLFAQDSEGMGRDDETALAVAYMEACQGAPRRGEPLPDVHEFTRAHRD